MTQALAGVVGLLALAWLLSERRQAVPWRAVLGGLALQAVLAWVLLELPLAKSAFFALHRLLTGSSGRRRRARRSSSASWEGGIRPTR